MKIQFPFQVNETRLIVEATVLPSAVEGYANVVSARIMQGRLKKTRLSQISEQDLKNAAIAHINAFKRLNRAIA